MIQMELITVSEFARRIGVSEAAVRRAIKDGRISAWYEDRGRKRIDPETAAQEWMVNSRFRIESAGVYDLYYAANSALKTDFNMLNYCFESPDLNDFDR